jgi:tRNA A-37 threonylcarbamoyl transferase component Bud32
MNELPLKLTIRCIYPKTGVESVLCTGLLRYIEGRRAVYDALWDKKSVIVKVFPHILSAKKHTNREWQGLINLKKRDIPAPKPLFYGKTQDKQWAVVMEKISDSSTAIESLNQTKDRAGKLNLLLDIYRELANYHKKGVLQQDLHLGNFLLANNKIYALDPSQMRFLPSELTRNESLRQLAMLLSGLPGSDKQHIDILCREYFKVRRWDFQKQDENLIAGQLIVQTKKIIRKSLKKWLRTGKRSVQIKTDNHISIFDRDFSNGADTFDFLERIDKLMDEGHILKNGNTCYVSRLTWNERDIVIKRYNHKGLTHSLRHTIKGSRARRAWLQAHRLDMLDVATPKALAYIEQRKAGLIWTSYLVTEYVQGQEFCYFLEDQSLSEQDRSQTTRQVIELLDNIGKYKISHGDLKHSNILITQKGPTITDLDAMKMHRWNWAYKSRRIKDLERLSNGNSRNQTIQNQS